MYMIYTYIIYTYICVCACPDKVSICYFMQDALVHGLSVITNLVP